MTTSRATRTTVSRMAMTAVAAALLTLSACGGDDSGDVSIASTPTTEADASSPTDADADAEPPKADDADDNGDLDVEMFYGEAGMYDGERLWSGAISMPFDALRDEPGEGFYIRRIEGAKVYAEGASSLLVDDGMLFLYDKKQFAAYDLESDSIDPVWTSPLEPKGAVQWTVGETALWAIAGPLTTSGTSGPAQFLTLDRATGTTISTFEVLPTVGGGSQANISDGTGGIVECAGGAVAQFGSGVVRWGPASTAPDSVAARSLFEAAGGAPYRLSCAGDTIFGFGNNSFAGMTTHVHRIDATTLTPEAAATVELDGEAITFTAWGPSDERAAIFIRDRGLATFPLPLEGSTAITAEIVVTTEEFDDLYLGDPYGATGPFPEPGEPQPLGDDVVLPGYKMVTIVRNAFAGR